MAISCAAGDDSSNDCNYNERQLRSKYITMQSSIHADHQITRGSTKYFDARENQTAISSIQPSHSRQLFDNQPSTLQPTKSKLPYRTDVIQGVTAESVVEPSIGVQSQRSVEMFAARPTDQRECVLTWRHHDEVNASCCPSSSTRTWFTTIICVIEFPSLVIVVPYKGRHTTAIERSKSWVVCRKNLLNSKLEKVGM